MISKDDLKDFTARTRLFGDHRKGVNLAADVCVDPIEKRIWFELLDHHKWIYKGPSLEYAIDLYNKIISGGKP